MALTDYILNAEMIVADGFQKWLEYPVSLYESQSMPKNFMDVFVNVGEMQLVKGVEAAAFGGIIYLFSGSGVLGIISGGGVYVARTAQVGRHVYRKQVEQIQRITQLVRGFKSRNRSRNILVDEGGEING